FPGAGDIHNLRLASQSSFRAHFARDTRDLRGERAKLIHHRIDGVLQFENLALDVDRNFLGQISVSDGSRNFGDVAYLARQVTGHQVHAVSQVLPGAGHTLNVSLSAEFSFRTDLARHARDFRSERIELIHHRVNGVFKLQNLAFYV